MSALVRACLGECECASWRGELQQGDDTLKWYPSSEYAQRGFCSACGSSLFWVANGLEAHKDKISVSLGALDAPTDMSLEEHIFVGDKGDYYDISDSIPQKEKY